MSDRACRACGAHGLETVLDLGRTPLANALLNADQLDRPEPTYPLELVFCPSCTLVQITETVPPEELFGEYLYFSSFSDTMLRHAREIVQRLADKWQLGPNSLVVEIASNDGYLLQYYVERGIPVLGIEPARNIARVAEERGVRTLNAFYGEEVAKQLAAEGKRADVVHANNVFAHVADTNGFIAGLRYLLKPNGIAVIEAPYVKDMIDHCEFDTIYHEHLCYFSLTAVDHLVRRHGLEVIDVERLAIHGGTLRFTIGHPGAHAPSPAVRALLDEEARWGVASSEFYRSFGERVAALKTELTSLLSRLKKQGGRIAAYGASAKGSTLLNYMGIGRETLDFVVDRSTVKQGRYTPGTRLPIKPPEDLLRDRPDHVLLLTWNFADEILAQQAAYRAQGGRFIVPVPHPAVI